MPYRRFMRGRSFVPRRKPQYLWIRSTENNATPNTLLNTNDLMSVYRSSAGVSLNIPEFTIWRIRIKISVSFSYVPAVYTANTGLLVALFVDDMALTQLNPVVSPYNQQYLMWDEIYAAQQIMESNSNPTTAPVYYAQYDIKAHRK